VTEHHLILALIIIGFTAQLAGLVYQESERTRAALGRG
jgi:hypothetical protein